MALTITTSTQIQVYVLPYSLLHRYNNQTSQFRCILVPAGSYGCCLIITGIDEMSQSGASPAGDEEKKNTKEPKSTITHVKLRSLCFHTIGPWPGQNERYVLQIADLHNKPFQHASQYWSLFGCVVLHDTLTSTVFSSRWKQHFARCQHVHYTQLLLFQACFRYQTSALDDDVWLLQVIFIFISIAVVLIPIGGVTLYYGLKVWLRYQRTHCVLAESLIVPLFPCSLLKLCSDMTRTVWSSMAPTILVSRNSFGGYVWTRKVATQ